MYPHLVIESFYCRVELCHHFAINSQSPKVLLPPCCQVIAKCLLTLSLTHFIADSSCVITLPSSHRVQKFSCHQVKLYRHDVSLLRRLIVDTSHNRVIIGWPMSQAVPSLFVFSSPSSKCSLATMLSTHCQVKLNHLDVLSSRHLIVETSHHRVMIGWPMCQAVPSLFVFSLPLGNERMANVSSSAESLCFLITITSPHTSSSYH